MRTPDLLLGIDGGGTGCRARLRSADGRLLGEGVAGPANIRLGLDTAWASILTAVDQALGMAGLDRGALPGIRAGLGLAGVVTAEDGRRVAAAGPRFAALTAVSDAHTACLGAFGGRDGGIVIAGTGSAGYAVIGGRGHAIGGWGFEVSDDGSGADIGRQCVRAALQAHDGLIRGSAFTAGLIDRLGGSPADIVDWVGRARPGDFGRLAPLALVAAGEGDPVARGIIAGAADAIALLARRLVAIGAPSLCLMGGLSGPLRPWLPADVIDRVVAPQGDAMDGALLLARKLERSHDPA